MATLGKVDKTALIVIDAQNGVMREAYNRSQIIQNIRQTVTEARKRNATVFWVQHSDSHLKFESNDWEIVPELIVNEGEKVIQKHFHSAFEMTELFQNLVSQEISHLILVGAATNWCIRATAYAALDKGYDLTLVEDAHTTNNLELSPSLKIEARDVINDLNIVFKWISYPNRKSTVLPASEAFLNL